MIDIYLLQGQGCIYTIPYQSEIVPDRALCSIHASEFWFETKNRLNPSHAPQHTQPHQFLCSRPLFFVFLRIETVKTEDFADKKTEHERPFYDWASLFKRCKEFYHFDQKKGFDR